MTVTRPAIRFAGAVMLTTGLLLFADCALALVWEEPVTSLLAARDQHALRRELASLQPPVHTPDELESIPALAREARRRARPGHAIGQIDLPSLNRKYVIVQGIGTADLERGPGHYPTTPFPGENAQTVAVAGHRTTYLAPFRTLGDLRRGSRVVLKMPYATLTYEVSGKRVVLPADTAILDATGHPQLVLTTCDPPFSASHRLVILARLRDVHRT